MDDIETLMIDYVQFGRIFADRWKAMNLADEIEDLPGGIDLYVRRLETRRACPEEGEDVAAMLPRQLQAVRKATLAAKDAADPTSGERISLDKKLNDIGELCRAWQKLSALRGSILDRKAARMLCEPD
ncbi:hypothetical protein T8T21_15190 [Limimaricola variabilis]|uniref:hypothetical protein n=1 Tax=Limimaricola variabilis TaxID=1492771 RepID=UPI002AC8BA2F|nr:hypothetical protein [Limimaricola variabilis]WPY94430.1 hypothetical protein T8T21_15190 [Limimaricola variabilis]